MLTHVLLIALIILGMALLRLFRRFDGRTRGYMTVLAGEIVLGFAAMARNDDFLAAVTILLCVATVVVPWCLQTIARWLLARGHLAAFVRVIGVQATLMPGAGLGSDHKVLRSLLLMQTRGVDTALHYLHSLARQREEEGQDEGGELFVHEQIVTMLFYDMRWDEGIAHFERRFPLGYAVVHPRLALDLMRAYGEAQRFEHAANLLNILEENLGTDPNSTLILSQARLTFLAYAGAAQIVQRAIAGEHGHELGLSPARGALFEGIALARAGHRQRALDVWSKVGRLAGPRDQREVAASKLALKRPAAEPIELGPETQRYVSLVTKRLEAFLQTERLALHRGTMWGTICMVVLLAGGYVLTQVAGQGGIGLLQIGAFTPELWHAGSWGRAITAVFVQTDLLGLLLSAYAIWLGGHVFERLCGSARLLLVALVGGSVGLASGALVAASSGDIVGGGHTTAVAVLVAALWSLHPSRTPGVQDGARRRLNLTLVLLMGAQLLACLPSEHGVVVTPLSLVVASCIGIFFAALQGPGARRWGARIFQVAATLVVVGAGFLATEVGREDVEEFVLRHREQQLQVTGVSFQVPAGFAPRTAGSNEVVSLGDAEGWVDLQAQQSGGQVVGLAMADVPETAQAEAAGPGAEQQGEQQNPGQPARSLPLEINPTLKYQLSPRRNDNIPAAAEEILNAAEGTWSTHVLQRNGDVVARVLTRQFAGHTAAIVLAPAEILDRAPRLYATVLATATVAEQSAEEQNASP